MQTNIILHQSKMFFKVKKYYSKKIPSLRGHSLKSGPGPLKQGTLKQGTVIYRELEKAT